MDIRTVARMQRVDLSCDRYAGKCSAIVGESFHQDTLALLDAGRLARGGYVNFNAWLVPEPENVHDPLAVIVFAQDLGPIGHFSREDARRYRPAMRVLMKFGLAGVCTAHLAGGRPDAPNIGVWLSLEGPTKALHMVKQHVSASGPPP